MMMTACCLMTAALSTTTHRHQVSCVRECVMCVGVNEEEKQQPVAQEGSLSWWVGIGGWKWLETAVCC